MNHSVELKNFQNPFSIKNRIKRIGWNLFYIIFFRYFSLPIFKKWRVFSLRLWGAKLGKNCHIYSSAKIWAPWNLVMGDFSVLAPYVDVYNQGKITIGNNTVISQKTYLCASGHDISSSTIPLTLNPILIGDQVWVAADAFIGPDVQIGTGAVVGARASVFKNVEAWTVVGGNPAVFIKKRIIKS